MFEIYGGATEFQQWDLDKQVANACMTAGDEVVFRNQRGETYVSKAFEDDGSVLADVPNYILQTAGNIIVELGQGSNRHSDCWTVFSVTERDKPEGYDCECNIPERTSASTDAVPDWNAQEGEAGYIKNRPGGYTPVSVQDCVYTASTSTKYSSQFGAWCKTHGLSVGDTVTVVCAGETYSGLAITASGDYSGTQSISCDAFSLGAAGYEGGGSFSYHDTLPDGATEVVFKSLSIVGEPVTFAPEYIPNNQGYKTTASGSYSHAEGAGSTASGSYSHAEGDGSTASGQQSHAEGVGSTASGQQSHAEGNGSTASGSYSHAEGLHTIAASPGQHVQGKYNIEDANKTYAHIVGNGTSTNACANAHTLDWSGVPWFQGRPQFGGTAQDDGSRSVMANGDKELILTSSTEDSTKRFKITVDDTGTLTATEVTE